MITFLHLCVCVCVNKNSSNQHGSSMFPGLHGDVAAVVSAGMCMCASMVYVCVFGRENQTGLFVGVKRGRVKLGD